MHPAALISAIDLHQALCSATPPLLPFVFDCSFDLAKPEAGRSAHMERRIPGARYLHLDQDLSAERDGRNGRHPLPSAQSFAQRMRALGLHDDSRVVAYDASGGMYAARLWWMLRWIGHSQVAVLDGGLQAWQQAGLALDSGPPAAERLPAAGTLSLRPSLVRTVSREDLLANIATQARLVIDARSPDRFRGENETLDPVGGRIPGAVNRFFKDNLDSDGRFKTPAELRAQFGAVAGQRPVTDWVMSCGSGVTACHNLLALEAAGLDGAALYPGSWSEWCAWPGAPVATGP